MIQVIPRSATPGSPSQKPRFVGTARMATAATAAMNALAATAEPNSGRSIPSGEDDPATSARHSVSRTVVPASSMIPASRPAEVLLRRSRRLQRTGTITASATPEPTTKQTLAMSDAIDRPIVGVALSASIATAVSERAAESGL